MTMLKALLKKQFLELNSIYFQNKKTGKVRSKAATAAFIALFALLYLMLAFVFFAVASTFASAFVPAGLDWLYFALLGLLSIFLGTFGSVFNTYSSLYRSGDNELLLSMPIPPAKILFARMSGVFSMSLLYSAIAWIPAFIEYWLIKTPGLLAVILPLLLTLFIALFVSVLTCLLGWVVALVSSRLKSKTFATVALSLLLFFAYYYIYFRINSLLNSVVENGELIASAIRRWVFPIYFLGKGASGDILGALIFAAFTALLAYIAYRLLSRSFISIATANRGEKKASAKKQSLASKSPSRALLYKELKRFTGSSTYMLNCGLGIVMFVLGAAVAVIQYPQLQKLLYIEELPAWFLSSIPLIILSAVNIISSMNVISAPSVSLEGNAIWILQSLPVTSRAVLSAKLGLHTLLNAPPAVLCAAVLCVILKLGGVEILLTVLSVILFTRFFASFGLMIGLKLPNLTWTNESVPVKQGSAVVISLFAGWVISVVAAAPYFIFLRGCDMRLYLIAAAAIIAVVDCLIELWIRKRGTQIFENL
jgi:ABC-2 type transport system permease protein